MKELDPWVFVSVFQEMLGFWLWAMLLGALAVVLAFVVLVVWGKTIVSRRLVRAELLGLLGGFGHPGPDVVFGLYRRGWSGRLVPDRAGVQRGPRGHHRSDVLGMGWLPMRRQST
ncbi:MAG: hypothetical protein ACI83N_000187 [Hydrogenophaga sp.]|jgi:hypothetical protein